MVLNKVKKYLFLNILIAFLLKSCTVHVDSSHDRSYDFSKVKTYAFSPDLALNTYVWDSTYIIQMLERDLKMKGLRKTEHQPDVFISIMRKEKQGQKTNVVSLGTGTGVGNFGFGLGIPIPFRSKKLYHSYKLSFLDVRSKRPVWEAIYNNETSANPSNERKQKIIDQAIKKMLKNYPPK